MNRIAGCLQFNTRDGGMIEPHISDAYNESESQWKTGLESHINSANNPLVLQLNISEASEKVKTKAKAMYLYILYLKAKRNYC